MLHTLSPQQLTVHISAQDLGFSDTSELTDPVSWIGQAEALKAARFGLAMKRPGFHLLVLGEHGSGRTSLMLKLMQEVALERAKSPDLMSPDLVLLYNFDAPEKPLALYFAAGQGAQLRTDLEAYVRQLAKTLPAMLNQESTEPQLEQKPEQKSQQKKKEQNKQGTEPMAEGAVISELSRQTAIDWIAKQIAGLEQYAAGAVSAALPAAPAHAGNSVFSQYLGGLKQDLADNLELFAAGITADNEGLIESFLSRYRVNLLVDNRHVTGAPVLYDDDPSFHTLFGGFESAGDNASATADFMRLRAGKLLKAHGGMFMLHLRDIQADQQNGSQILEKLQRVLRNRSVQIEESSGGSGSSASAHFSPDALPLDVKVVLIASREEYYALHDELPDFAQYFTVKVDFSERFAADNTSYRYVAQYVALQCTTHQVNHFTAGAVARLAVVMQRRIDDQTRISANFGYLQGLIFESAVFAEQRAATLVDTQDVNAALAARLTRYQQPEQQQAEAIADGELTISVHCEAIGQINGLTHIDLGDACFGSPVRISATCYAGDEGVINIDREVEMTGPNHDKGLFILRSWLSSNFTHLTPLSLSASLVFEQEYHGVEGDSASCAELYALLSALSGKPIQQGLAVTGALNQHGEVMAIGGVNEKIEGYFRICRRLGLTGKQGVVIPSRNVSHLLLDDDVIEAVAAGQFHIYAVDSVQDGIAVLTGQEAGVALEQGGYSAGSVLAEVQSKLQLLRHGYASNRVQTTGKP